MDCPLFQKRWFKSPPLARERTERLAVLAALVLAFAILLLSFAIANDTASGAQTLLAASALMARMVGLLIATAAAIM